MEDQDVIDAYVDGGLSIMTASISLVNPAFGMIAIGAQPMLAKKIKQGFANMIGKGITKREYVRLDKALDGMTDSIESNIKEKQPLNSNVLQINEDGFTDADDLFEEMLKQIKNESESKKAYFCGIFIGNIPYSDNLSCSNLMQYEKIISQLSYSHLCLLRAFSNPKISNGNNCGGADNYVRTNPTPDILEVYSELLLLKSLGLLRGVPPYSLGTQLGKVEISDFGTNLCKLMRLHLLDENDVSRVNSLIEKFRVNSNKIFMQ